MTVSMTQKSAKKKSKKSAKAGANPSVLGSLRSTRPTRLGGDRRVGATASRATAAKPKATRSPAAKPKKAKTKSPAAATQPKATAAHRPTPPPPPPRPANGRPSGTEIVTTAVQAVGELAQIGATVGTQLLKRAAQRLPRP
jgi:hypothetical protein